MKRLDGQSAATLLAGLVHRGLPDRAKGATAPVARFVPLLDIAALDEWFSRSNQHAVTLFLHDPGCPISAHAYRQMARVDAEIPLVDVRSGRLMTEAIKTRTGVRHESPQVLVLHRGRAVWSASHYGIKTVAVEEARRHVESNEPGT